jgi:hypothetical protein
MKSNRIIDPRNRAQSEMQDKLSELSSKLPRAVIEGDYTDILSEIQVIQKRLSKIADIVRMVTCALCFSEMDLDKEELSLGYRILALSHSVKHPTGIGSGKNDWTYFQGEHTAEFPVHESCYWKLLKLIPGDQDGEDKHGRS